MRVLETRITDMRYDEDFGRVEAAVALIVKPRPGQPARQVRLRTSQPLAGETPVEQRLAEDAIRLARRLAEVRQPLPQAPGHVAARAPEPQGPPAQAA